MADFGPSCKYSRAPRRLRSKPLTFCPSQSKLSQQDLADLQKVTKFDKKELQQWYKGKSISAFA
jgi:hypothetical protein